MPSLAHDAGEELMIGKLTACLVILVCTSMAADAQVVTWEARGTVTTVETSGGFITDFPAVSIGSEFLVLVEYDASTPVTSINSSTDFGGTVWIGDRYRYDTALISINLSIDGVPLMRSPDGFNLLDIWDNFGFAGVAQTTNECFEPGVACDGIATSQGLASSENGGFASVALVLRGPELLDIYSGIGLPTEPSPALLSLSETFFQFVDQTDVIIGEVETLSRFITPGERLDELFNKVVDTGPGGSLANKIEQAQAYLAVPDIESACGILKAFINQVSAQSEKNLAPEQATELITNAQDILDAIGCN
jgi:hypothetical protein